MSRCRYEDVSIFATDTPWPQVRPEANTPQPSQSYWPPSFLRSTNSPNKSSQFSPIICPPIARPLAPTHNAPSQNITNLNHGGLSAWHHSVQSIAHRNDIVSHQDYPIDAMVGTTALPHNHNSAPQYPPGLGWETKLAPRSFYDEYIPRDSDKGFYSNSLVARSFKYRPSVSRFDPFRDEDTGVDARGYRVDTKPYDDLELPSLSWLLDSPRDSPPLSECDAQGLPNISATSTQVRNPVSAFAHLFPPVPSNHAKSRVLNALKARARDVRLSFSRFNPFRDEDAFVDACGFQSFSSPQADLKVSLVPFQPDNNDPVLSGLDWSRGPVHLVELSSESSGSGSCETFSPVSECPSRLSGSDFASPPIQHPVSTCGAHVSDNVPSIKLPGPFVVVKELQAGSYGQAVAVCELGDTTRPRLFCLKVFKKSMVLSSKTHGGVKTELQAYRRLAEAQPLKEFIFLMKIDAALQDDKHIYFAMDLMQFDLATVIYYQEHREQADRWLAQIATGIAALHEVGIIHRDIKPENVLIDWQHNIRLVDFGFSYVHERRVPMSALGPCAYDYVGTVGFVAPEVIDHKGGEAYSNAVDFWSFGCLVFEALNCDPSTTCLFEKPETLDLYKEANRVDGHGRGFLHQYEGLSEEAIDLLSGLLELDPAKRFGIAEIKSHTYFDCANGSNYFRGIEAKARRQTRLEIDIDGDSAQSDLPSQFVSVIDDQQHAEFAGFDWINPTGVWGGHPKS